MIDRLGRVAMATGLLLCATSAAAVVPSPPAQAFGTETFYGTSAERLLDTRSGSRVAAGSSVDVFTGHDDGRPVAVNVISTGATGTGNLSVYACGGSANGTTVVNFQAGINISNSVVVKPRADGCLGVQVAGSSTHVLVDYTGSVTPGRWAHNGPARVYDSRTGGAPPLAAGTVTTISGYIANSGVSLNFTVTGAASMGHLRAYPCNEGLPVASSGNCQATTTVASGYVVKADSSGKVCVWNQRSLHLIIDRFGAITSGTGTAFQLPTRIYNTGTVSTVHTLSFGGGAAGVSAFALGVTVVSPGATGRVTAYPCDSGPYTGSTLNYTAGVTKAHSVVMMTDVDGQICFGATTGVSIIVDRFGALQMTGKMVEFAPNSFTYTGGNSNGLGTTSLGLALSAVPGYSTELDRGYATSGPPGTTSAPVWIGGHNQSHGAVFGHIDNIANGAVVRMRFDGTYFTRTIQGRYLAAVGSPAPTGHTFFLQTSQSGSQVWLIHN